MTTTPKWVYLIDREYRAKADAIWEEHRQAVREARRAFDDALEKPRAKRDRLIAAAGKRYREAKRGLRDRAATEGEEAT